MWARREIAQFGEVVPNTRISVLFTQVTPCSMLVALCSLLLAPADPIHQVLWSEQVEEVLARGSEAEAGMAGVLAGVNRRLGLLANCVLQEQLALRRKKIENLIGEYVHRRSVLPLHIKNKIENIKDFEWLQKMSFYDEFNRLEYQRSTVDFLEADLTAPGVGAVLPDSGYDFLEGSGYVLEGLEGLDAKSNIQTMLHRCNSSSYSPSFLLLFLFLLLMICSGRRADPRRSR